MGGGFHRACCCGCPLGDNQPAASVSQDTTPDDCWGIGSPLFWVLSTDKETCCVEWYNEGGHAFKEEWILIVCRVAGGGWEVTYAEWEENYDTILQVYYYGLLDASAITVDGSGIMHGTFGVPGDPDVCPGSTLTVVLGDG